MRELCQCINIHSIEHNDSVTAYDEIDAIKNAGFDRAFVQWYDEDWKISQQQLVDYCKQIGLKIEFAHLGYQGINNIWLEGEAGDSLVPRYKKDLDECKKNGIDLVIMHLCSKSVAPDPNEIGVRRLREIVDYAETLDIRIAFENTKIFGYIEYVLERIKNKNAGVCFDIGHCHAFFDDYFNFEKFKDKIFAVHLHDNDKSSDLHRLPFDSEIDYEKFVRQLVGANYRGPVTLENHYDEFYQNYTISDFYKESYLRAQRIEKLFEKYDIL